MTSRVGDQPALDVRSEIAWHVPARVLRLHLQGVAHSLATRDWRDAREQAMREKATQPDDPLIVESSVPTLQPLSRIQQRLIQSAGEIVAEDPEGTLFQHTVFCQTGLPYRNPGEGQREWERRNGDIHLKVVAGEALHPRTGEWVKLGLPYGPKPRLILAYLNREALLHGSPEIEVDASLTAFAKGLLGYHPNGKEIRLLKDQLARLAASLVRMGVIRDGRTMQVEAKVVSAFDLWFPKNGQQR